MRIGWVSLHRKIIGTSWYKHPATARVAIHLLLIANHSSGEVMVSPGSISKDLGMKREEVRWALRMLERAEFCTTRVTTTSAPVQQPGRTVITICKYKTYQGLNENHNQGHNQSCTKSQPPLLNNKSNNKIRLVRFKPPTIQEIQDYNSRPESKATIDPEKFFDYYQARGWTLKGGTKMKDWKAAVRTWEKTEYANKQKPTRRKFKPGE